MKILLTGFEPFGGSRVNPSEQVARALDGQQVGDAQICAVILPVEGERGPAVLTSSLHLYQPDAVICLGEASGRSCISIERVAINLLDYRIPDNAGSKVVDQPVIPGGPDAYFVTLPVRRMLAAILAAGVPAELSTSAGTYLCNQVLYHLLHFCQMHKRGVPAGFIHLPCLPEQSATALTTSAPRTLPSMSMETLLAGIRAAVLAVVSLD